MIEATMKVRKVRKRDYQKILRELVFMRKTLLMEARIRQIDLANEWDRSESFISQLVHGKVKSDKHERLFAKRLRVARDRVFPAIEVI